MENENKSQQNVLTKIDNWSIDSTHSKIQFSVRHMIISEVLGNFKSFDFNIKTDSEDFSNSDIELSIDVRSVDTGVSDRDNHLRSADFFEVDKFPVMHFKSKTMKMVNEEKYKLVGDLTIKGITKEIELDVLYNGQVLNPFTGKVHAGFKVTGSLNRFDYDLKWNALIETGGAVVGKNVNIIGDIELVKQ